jgi:thiamine-phosphate pyrophosphorylase
MKSRKSLLKKSQLYLILDKPTFGNGSLKKICGAVKKGSVGLIQLRDKKSVKSQVLHLANKLANEFKKSKTLFIVNDDLDLAVAIGADGVHLGQDDLSLQKARKILGADKIIGISCHSLRQALRAQIAGADYIGVGPIFSTSTKLGSKPIGLEVLRQLKNKIKIPYFAIGNINMANISEIIDTKTKRVAVCRAIIKAKDFKLAIKQFNKILK